MAGGQSGERGAGMDQQAVAGRDRRHQGDLDRGVAAVLAAAQRERALVIDAQDSHRDAVVAAGDAVL